MKPQNTKYQLSWQQHCSFLENKYSLTSNGRDISAARYHPVSPYTAARAGPIVREWIRWWTLLYSNICATYFMFCFRSNDIILKWGKWKLYRLFKWNKQPKKEIEVRQMRCPTLTEEFPLLAGPSCVIVENVGAPILSCTTAWAHHSADARWLQHEPSLLIHRLCFLLNDVEISSPMFDCILSFLTLQLYMKSEAILRYLKHLPCFLKICHLHNQMSDAKGHCLDVWRCYSVLGW